ncbi:Fc.00g031420.m01.CDS01 [Cosmosporella sp. VM-42]
MAPYRNYRPLDSTQGEIRLLMIQPAASYSSPIVCKLTHEYLPRKPKYDCLSYVWGQKEGGTDINLDGASFRVYENCEAALRRLRNWATSRTVWIDAICINQGDSTEKNSQVQLMGDIYHQAQQVCVWLGELTDGGIVGVKSIQGKLTMGWYMWQVDRKYGKPTLPVRESFGDSVSMQNRSNLVQEQELGEIKEILDRPWFTRVWIMQEAVLARKLVLMCGPEVMSWDRIGTVIRRGWIFKGFPAAFGMTVNPRDEFPDETYQVICQFREKWAAGGWNANLYWLLFDYRHLDSTMPQDRIYGFLGLDPVAKNLGIQPNYDLSPGVVYTSFARTVVERHLCLDILNCVREWKDSRATFPDRPAVAYSILDQSRYHDIYASITDGPEYQPRKGWARLPPGWERTQEEGKPCYFLNHNDGTYHEKSPLEGCDPISSVYYADQRTLPKGWTKQWNNVGQARVEFSPGELRRNKQEERLSYLKGHGLDMLPSWVPNWAARTAIDPTPILDWSDVLPQYWTAGEDSTTNVMPTSDPDILGLEGAVFDTIDTLACSWHPKSDIGPLSRKGIDELEIWEALAIADVENCPYTHIGGRRNALWRTLIADWAGNRAAAQEASLLVETWYDRVGWLPELQNLTSRGIRDTVKREQSLRDIEGAMMKHFMDLQSRIPRHEEYTANTSFRRMFGDIFSDAYKTFSEAYKIPKLYGEYVKRIRRACAHRAMFITRRGYMGLAPWNAQEGDLVCILKGGKTPFLLRLPPAGSVYQLVGETYVYGIMGGEAIAELERSKAWQVMNLR